MFPGPHQDLYCFPRQLLRVEGGRQPAQTLLRSLLGVFTAPRFDQRLGVGQDRKPVLVQVFVADTPGEGLDVGVLVRLAGFNET